LLAIDVGVEETEDELDYMGLSDLRRRPSRYLVDVQFDFSPETSATARLARPIQVISAPGDYATACGGDNNLHMMDSAR
jgi:hypothetical protein